MCVVAVCVCVCATLEILLYCDFYTRCCLLLITSFLSSQEFTGGDVSDLYLEEKEEQLKKAALEKRKAQESVPGIINPYDRTDDNQDMQ